MKKFFLLNCLMLISILSINAQNDIRQIDFKNFTYEPYCAGEDAEKVTVQEGEFSEEKQEDGYVDRFFFTIFSVEYGDATGDGKEDAVILSSCNTGGTGNFTEGFIYELKNGKPSLVTRIPGGDRAYGGLVEARVENGLVVVVSNDVGEAGGACCPEFIVTDRYKLSGSKLVETGKSERKELYPAQNVQFAKGASSTVLKLKFSVDDDRKRFSLRGKQGQVLRVTSPQKVYVDVRKGDAETTDNESGFIATFTKTGEIVIEIQYYTETEVELPITLEIR